jgi:AbrB family looped-hinge helix DNA binding protein
MYAVHEIATLTSKGQITLPKPIRDALGVDAGSKIAFDLVDSEIRVSRVMESSRRPKYKLSELLAEMPDTLPMVEGWDEMPSVGLEKH